MKAEALFALLLACAPQVDPRTAAALVEVESSLHPHAIGMVGGQLQRQPRTGAEAIATAHALHADGWNFSVGLAQINVHNLPRLGLSLEGAFDPCTNLRAMQTVLGECMDRAQTAPSRRTDQLPLRRALSCYYSGNFSTGFAHGYVRRVALAAARAPLRPLTHPTRTTP